MLKKQVLKYSKDIFFPLPFVMKVCFFFKTELKCKPRGKVHFYISILLSRKVLMLYSSDR